MQKLLQILLKIYMINLIQYNNNIEQEFQVSITDDEIYLNTIKYIQQNLILINYSNLC
jgi:hypothetical protein